MFFFQAVRFISTEPRLSSKTVTRAFSPLPSRTIIWISTIEVLDAQAQTLHQTQAAPVQQSRHQLGCSTHLVQNGSGSHFPFAGMTSVVEKDVTLDPVHVSLFGADGIVFDLNGITDLIE